MSPATAPAPALDLSLRRLVAGLLDHPSQGIQHFRDGTITRTTYAELHDDVVAAEKRLVEWGVGAGARVGIMAHNSYEWLVTDLALLDLGAVSVPLPVEEMADRDLDAIGARHSLELLVVGDDIDDRGSRLPWMVDLGPSAAPPIELRAAGVPTLPDDVFTLVFSSGTTGDLKCIKISRSGTEASIGSFQHHYTFAPDDAILVCLPLSIFQQRIMCYSAMLYGFDVHLCNPPQIFSALKDMRPTIMGGPPAFYELLESRVRAMPEAKLRKIRVLATALKVLPRPLRSRVARRAFAEAHDVYGGRMRLMLSGSAAIRLSTLDLFEDLGLPLYQLYGLTETGFIAWNSPVTGNRKGSVGKPVFPGSVTLASDNEILVRYDLPGSLGYEGVDPEVEASTYLADGAIATGDIGSFDEDGFLSITGRKKQILITRGGYKVQPESIENRLLTITEVGAAVVVGGDDLPDLVAIVSEPGTDPKVQERVRSLVAEINEAQPSPARINRVVFTDVPFTRENGLLTRSLKLDRAAIVQRFGTELGTVPR